MGHCLYGVFWLFRLGELLVESADRFNPTTDLAWGDVAADSATHPSMLKIHLKQSKCDQFGVGVDIVIGRTGCALCPVSALLSYISLRQDPPGAFFLNLEGRPITKAWFVSRIRAVLAVLGFPQHEYAGHSFRIWAATSAALAGIEDSTIQALGRW